MNTAAQPVITDVHELIASHNPFEGHFVTKTKDLWRDNFFDVSSINFHVSDHIFRQLYEVNNETAEINDYGILIKAPRGRGKTHILNRISHRLREEGTGVFIYVCEYGDLSNIRYSFLQALTASLKKKGKTGLPLWQELASNLINSVLRKKLESSFIVEKFPQILLYKPDQCEEFLRRICDKHQFVIDNPDILRAILWTLSSVHAPYAINWLSGRGLTDKQAERMDLPKRMF